MIGVRPSRDDFGTLVDFGLRPQATAGLDMVAGELRRTRPSYRL